MDTPGMRFARALAGKDVEALRDVLAEDVDFRGLTPRRDWEAAGVDGVLDILLGSWFEPQDVIEKALAIDEGDAVEDTAQVRYRFAITTPDGPHVAEQQAYYRATGDRIDYLRVMCSGFRPTSA